MTCDGCNTAGATETLHLAAPLGLTCVRVHRDRACAEAAREARGGGRFITPPATTDKPEAAVNHAAVAANIRLRDSIVAYARAMRKDQR